MGDEGLILALDNGNGNGTKPSSGLTASNGQSESASLRLSLSLNRNKASKPDKGDPSYANDDGLAVPERKPMKLVLKQ
jgi:hypothetical protein